MFAKYGANSALRIPNTAAFNQALLSFVQAPVLHTALKTTLPRSSSRRPSPTLAASGRTPPPAPLSTPIMSFLRTHYFPRQPLFSFSLPIASIPRTRTITSLSRTPRTSSFATITTPPSVRRPTLHTPIPLSGGGPLAQTQARGMKVRSSVKKLCDGCRVCHSSCSYTAPSKCLPSPVSLDDNHQIYIPGTAPSTCEL